VETLCGENIYKKFANVRHIQHISQGGCSLAGNTDGSAHSIFWCLLVILVFFVYNEKYWYFLSGKYVWYFLCLVKFGSIFLCLGILRVIS
jgi:hypothetical protein